MRFRDGIFFLLLGVALGASGCIALDYWHDGNTRDELAAVRGQLDDSRLALESARARSDSLERGLYEARNLAVDSARTVGDAVQAANSITDRGQRIVKLVEAIRGVLKDLKRISEAGSLIQPP